jgi:hypothetical protein
MAVATTEAEEKTQELFEGAITPKQPRHIQIALNHLNKQRDRALAKQREVEAELKSLDAAILALG